MGPAYRYSHYFSSTEPKSYASTTALHLQTIYSVSGFPLSLLPLRPYFCAPLFSYLTLLQTDTGALQHMQEPIWTHSTLFQAALNWSRALQVSSRKVRKGLLLSRAAF